MGMLQQQLQHRFGAHKNDCIDLSDTGDCRRLRYADLIRARARDKNRIDMIVEQTPRALLYVVDCTSNSRDDLNVPELRRTLAMRGDQSWLGILKPGQLDIYSTDLKPSHDAKPVSFQEDDPSSMSLLPRLAQGETRLAQGEAIAEVSKLHLRQVLFGLMTSAAKDLTRLHLTPHEAIALTGRALFLRYLIGRGIVKRDTLPRSIAQEAKSWQDCMASGEALAATNEWLSKTFNGDLLPLPDKDYSAWFSKLTRKHGNKITKPLSAIMSLAVAMAPDTYQRELEWKDLDFNHVPIGLLSEIYEELMHQLDPEAQKNTSVYYTPWHIAEYMVEQAFRDLPNGHKARVLDPACGAGIFLVSSFRKLVELRYRETGEPPKRGEIRRVLNNQLVGMDINSHARTLTALSLYLTALELDPKPSPIDDLKFKEKLEGRVLVDVRDPESPEGLAPMAGSLGDHVFNDYKGRV